jgi:type I restriction enzyme R subunit
MSPESEKETRRKRIDRQLDALGWPALGGHAQADGPYRKPEIETASGPADYGLYLRDNLVGIVEAKKLAVSPQNVLSQAERYSEGAHDGTLSFGKFRVPFVYSSNGEVIWFRDVRHDLNRSRTVASFHTPGGLAEALSRHPDEGHGWLRGHPSEHLWLRGYQHDACHAIERAVMDRKRRMLVAMATGTGKTFTIVNEIYRLMASKTARRVLFLVDRRVLAAQAVRAFAAFEPEPGMKFDKLYEVYSQRFFRGDLDSQDGFDPTVLPEAYLTDPDAGHTFVYLSTIQRMAMNLFGKDAVAVAAAGAGAEGEADEGAPQLNIPIHAFDVVVADECHRGYTSAELSLWRNTIDHFDAIKIGMTATPAAHSKAYFKDVVFRYDYETAVADGYLVDYDVLTFRSNVRVNGVFLKEGEEVATVDTTSGQMNFDLLEDERSYDSSEIERAVTVPDSNRKLLEELKRYTDEHEQRYARFPKTLIFAANDLPHTSHADQIVDIARDVFGQGDAFVRKITGREDRPLQRIREFRNRPKPGIAVSVDLMSTGVDIPDLEFIVFMRPIKSRILFEQMLGRGTRLGEKHPDKTHFTVVDCFDGTLLEYFRNTTGITAVPPDKPSKTIPQLVEDIWDNRDRDYAVRCLVKRLQRIDKGMSGEARQMFAAYVPDGDLAAYASRLRSRLDSAFGETMNLLRDAGFQDLLVNYPRPLRSFLIAVEPEDEVSSQWKVRGADGKEYKPEDYLKEFERFIQDNAEHIDGIEILLGRPQDWSTEALEDLQQKLATSPLRFTTEHLQKAHRLRYDVALADLISMIKRAADTAAPLLTAEQRVDTAMASVTAGRSFDADQALWLDRIRNHLVQNLSVDTTDFNVVPLFVRHGGLGRARKVFGDDFASLLAHLNEAVAA